MNVAKYKLASGVMILCLISSVIAFAQTTSKAQFLPVAVLERDIKRGETHGYKINLKTGEFLRVRVEQRGIDVVVRLFAPTGKLLVERDRPNGKEGEESLAAEAVTTGEHLIEVTVSAKDELIGKYSIASDVPRYPTAADKNRIAAEISFQEAMKLRETQTEESQRKALAQYESALAVWQTLKDDYAEALTLSTMAFTKILLGEPEQAAKHFISALRKAEMAGSKLLERNIKTGLQALAEIYYDSGEKLFKQGTLKSKQTAAENLKLASELYREIEDKTGEASSNLGLGRIASSFGEKESALKYYEKALTFFREVDNKSGEGTTLNNIGKVYSDLGDHRQALKFYTQALPLRQEVDNKRGEAVTLAGIGAAYSALGDKQQALKFYNQALPLTRAVADKNGEVHTLFEIGMIYADLGNRQQALEFYNQALPIFQAFGNKRDEATTLTNIGIIYSKSGDKQQALKLYAQALPLRREANDKRGEASTLGNIGAVYSALGDNQEALKFYNQALLLHREVGNKSGEAIILSNIAEVYSYLGDNQQALKNLNQALQIFQEVDDKSGKATILSNIGKVYSDLGDNQQALKSYIQALPLFQEAGDKEGEAQLLANAGTIYLELGDKQQALKFYNRALSFFREVGGKSGESNALNNIGGFYSDSGDERRASDYYNQSLLISRELGDKKGESITLNNLMLAFESQNNRRLAIIYGKQTINIYQELRQNINTLDNKIQKTYLKSIEKSYRFLADILIAEGRIAEAEEVLAMLKEEEFFAYLRRDDKVAAELKRKISLSADERKAFEDYEKYADDITRIAAEFGALEKKMNDLPQGAKLSDADQAEYDRLKKNYDAAVTVFSKFLDDLKIKFGTADNRVAIVESNTQNILRAIKQPRTVIISTIAGEDRLNLIVTTMDIRRAHTVEIKASDLNKLITDFRAAVKNPAVDPRPLGKKLYDALFPVALQKDLDNIKAETIVWSLDGGLRYVPMAALWDGKNYLAERYTNAVLTLAVLGNLNVPRANRADWRALGVGVSKAFQNFPKLPAVPQELCSVVRDPQKKDFCQNSGAQRAGVIDGLLLSDEEFTLQTFQNELGKVPIVHIASHFSLNAGDESDSFLLLGGGAERRFWFADLQKRRLDKVELLTLSACNTAMTAGNNSNGVEVEGFGALAQHQGAKSVLATLWAVADDSTRDLMTEFYTELEKNPSIGKAEVLRKAQIKLINGKYKTEDAVKKRGSEIVRFDGNADNLPKYTKDKNAPFAHPYFWSPFILFGNWK